MPDEIDKLVFAERGFPYPWLVCRNAEGRRTLMCNRCAGHKRVSYRAEQSPHLFAQMAADFIIRHKLCRERATQ